MKELFSFFPSYSQTNPVNITLAQVYVLITTDAVLRGHTERHRSYLRTGDSQKAAFEKKACYAFTPAVLCSGGRQRKHIVAYTGVSLCDLDDIAPERMTEVLSLIRTDPHTLLAYITISGLGIRILFSFEGVRVEEAEPASTETLKAYQEAYRQGNEYYARLVGQEYDGSCKNPERISGLAYDPDAFFHPEAQPLTIHPVQKQANKSTPNSRPGSYQATPEKAAKAACAELETEEIHYEAGNHNTYIMRTGYLFNNYGVPEAEAVAWAMETFADYGKATVESIFHSCYRKTEEHGTWDLSALQKRHRNANDENDFFATVEEIETFLSGQANFQYNIITHQSEIRWKENNGPFRTFTDRDMNSLWRRMNLYVKKARVTDMQNIINSEYVPPVNPLKVYMDALPPWDGVTDFITALSDTIHVKGDQAQFRAYFRKWFVGIFPTLFEEQTVNHVILVLIGEQGLYKTTWFNRLLPPSLRRYFYTKTNSNRLIKDDQFTLTEFALVCFEEIDSMRPNELNQLKAMVTTPFINERPFYGRYKEHRPHIASFCGTGNNIQFLTDPTGNRRWLPFEVENIDNPFEYTFPYESVYAQAMSLWKSGFQYWFSQAEIQNLNIHNVHFEAPNLEEELIMTYYRKPFSDESGVFVTTARILERINTCIRQPLIANKIGMVMKKLGFESVRYNSKRGYIVIELTGDDIQRSMKSAALGL